VDALVAATGSEAAGPDPRRAALAIFDVFDKWFRRSDFEGCAFAKVLLEHDEPGHPVRNAAPAHLETIRAFVKELALPLANAAKGDLPASGAPWPRERGFLGHLRVPDGNSGRARSRTHLKREFLTFAHEVLAARCKVSSEFF